MMPAAKHGDPQLGIDIHLCIVPPGATVPLPTPHLSIVFDPFDYLPLIGATTTVMGMKRACAGTSGIVVHIPPGFPFAKPPEKDDELFMGSATVIVDGDPFSHISHPVLGCQVAGMPSPGRVKKKPKKMCLLPTEFNLAIPSTVLIGGPPTISMAGLLTKGAFKALGTLAKKLGPRCSKLMKRFKAWRKAKWGHLPPGFLKCVILRAEPVDILTGAVSVDQQDFALSGRLPFDWLRGYSSNNLREGLCGIGWETPLDGRLEYDPESRSVGVFYPGIGPLYFDRLPRSVGEDAAELELMDGARLTDGGEHLTVRTKDDLFYRFRKAERLRRADGYYEIPLEQITDLSGNVLHIERQQGLPRAITLPGGRRLELSFAHGRLCEIALAGGEADQRHVLVQYAYTPAGDLEAVFDALEQPYTFAYDSGHRLVRHTDRNGLSFYYTYQQHGDEWRVDHAWGDGGLYDYRFEYWDTVRERRITDSLGYVSQVKLNEDGLPINELDPLGGMTIFEYDDCGRTCAVVDPAGRRTEYHYDARGNLLQQINPDGNGVVAEYDAANKVTLITAPNGAQWRQRWNTQGQLLNQTNPLGHADYYEYDAAGQLVAHLNPRGARTELAYDSHGNLVRIDNALGHTTRFEYDALGNVTSRLDPAGHLTRFRYDGKSRLTGILYPSGAHIECAYDAEDNLTAYRDENGAVTRMEYFGQGEIARRIQPDGHCVDYLYDTEERLVGLRNQRNELYQLRHDALGRVVEEIDYWGQSRRYAYDPGGHLTASLDPLGQRIDYLTDPLGRIVKKVLSVPESSDSTERHVEKFDYDANGNLLAASNAHVKISRDFDALGQLRREVQQHSRGDTFVVEHHYDEVGNRIRRETHLTGAGPQPVSATHRVDFAYDLLDEFIETRLDGGDPIRIRRDARSQATREEWGNALARDLRYTVDGLLSGQRTSLSDQTLFATDYAYDPAGNLTERQDSAFGIDRYRYDPLGRIVAHLDPLGRVEHFLHDPAGDRLQTRISGQDTHGSENDWQRTGESDGHHYRFNRAGNLTHRQSEDGLFQFDWDANQRLRASHRIEGGQRRTTHYAYDPFGRRLYKETDGQRTLFGWDGDALALDAIQGQVREFVYRPETFEPLALLGASTSGPLLYLNDPNGCPTRLIDQTGQLHWAASHTAWGAIAQIHQQTIDNPLRLQSQYADAETGLYYNRNRYYDAQLGTFISQDPIGLEGGLSLYQYGLNPISWTDPLGWTCRSSARSSTKGRGWLSWAKKWHDKRATEIFGKRKGASYGKARHYDKSYKGRDIEYKSDNFSRRPRSPESLKRMDKQIDTDINLRDALGANPHWHFEHDPRVAPEMKPLLEKLDSNKIPWTFGSSAPF